MTPSYRGLFHLYPLLPIAVMMVMGIACGRALYGHIAPIWPTAMSLLLLLLSVMALRHAALCTSSILATAVLGGVALSIRSEQSAEVELPQAEIEYRGVVVSQPVHRGRTIRFDVLVADGPYCGREVRVSLLKDTLSQRHAQLSVGNAFIATSQWQEPTNFGNSNFSYTTYLKSRGIVATTFVYHSKWHSHTISLQQLSLFDRARVGALVLRTRISNVYRSYGLDGQSLAVLTAMTLGDKTQLSKDTRDTYSITGASHVLALSGLHLGIIYSLLSLLCVGARWRVLREGVLLLSVWCYVFLVGMSPSVVRSAVMISVYGVVHLSGRGRSSLNALAFAAIVMLLYNPLVLFDIGFQLSFMAVAFILIFQPAMIDLLGRQYCFTHRFVGGLWQMVSMTIVAQAGTIPLVIYYFGRVPVYFIITNVVVIPAATVILYASVAFFALSVWPLLQQVVATALSCVVTMLNEVLMVIASWPCSSIEGLHINEWQVVLLYIAIVCVLWIVRIMSRRMEWLRYIRYHG